MSVFAWIIYLFFGIVIVAPLIQGDLFRVDKKYYSFKYVSIALLLWWLIIFAKLISPSGATVYYLTLMVYPTVFLFVFYLYIAIKHYFNSEIPNLLFYGSMVFFLLDFVVAMTNNLHDLFFTTETIVGYTHQMAMNTNDNIAFYIHMSVNYFYLAVITVYVMKNIIKRLRENRDVFPFVILVSAIALGIILNIIHIFVYTFTIDPTLIFIVIFISVLYYTFYIRDLKLILGFNRNRFILEHLREMYVVSDDQGIVVEVSKAFKNTFNIVLDESLTYENLLSIMKETAVLFKDSEEVASDYSPEKIYLNTFKKPIQLPFYKRSGTFYLFFDQTADLKYIHDMNYVKSHDLMTEIYNRNFLEDMRDSLDDNNIMFEIAMFDLDGLKLFNDHLGHNKGDELLKKFANELKEVCHGEENVYPIRLGGDEFLLLSIEKPAGYTQTLVKQLEEANTKKPFLEQNHFSYAVFSRDSQHDSLKLVLAEADLAMYAGRKRNKRYKEILEDELLKQIKKG